MTLKAFCNGSEEHDILSVITEPLGLPRRGGDNLFGRTPFAPTFGPAARARGQLSSLVDPHSSAVSIARLVEPWHLPIIPAAAAEKDRLLRRTWNRCCGLDQGALCTFRRIAEHPLRRPAIATRIESTALPVPGCKLRRAGTISERPHRWAGMDSFGGNPGASDV